MTKLTDIEERVLPVSLAQLNGRVTIAIILAEHEPNPENQRLAWASVSAIEEEIALHKDASEQERNIGRRGAIEAAIKAELYGRAKHLSDTMG
ncbi:MAG: hypothetical protein WC683_02295 [bacterium]